MKTDQGAGSCGGGAGRVLPQRLAEFLAGYPEADHCAHTDEDAGEE
ncbi:MAG TPA: hypothetical protein VF990_02630 [Candidatus Dormibacteraeota bacterium]